ncbi:MAG TPA: DUF5110 domain-containing protein, partial [Blastocatellia bacterium]|nr:DUF5110 domain-containing protein [Blastocatellia bacterium]
RYRLMPYLYSAVRETHETGLPVMRALWLHYPDDATAVLRGDQYLWGRDMLVAPVVEKGVTTRNVYLPRGDWYDFWTEERMTGGREVSKAVDLATMPLYARAGAIIPLGPVKQYTEQVVDAPLTLVIYPGADGTFAWYEDDGKTFDYQRGKFMRVQCVWNDRQRRLSLRLAPGTQMLPPLARNIAVRLAGTQATRTAVFAGKPLEVQF